MGPLNLLHYSIVIASTGHSSQQTAQSTQLSAFITALPSSIVIASLGHESRHDSQPVHVSASILAGIIKSFSKQNLNLRIKDDTKNNS